MREANLNPNSLIEGNSNGRNTNAISKGFRWFEYIGLAYMGISATIFLIIFSITYTQEKVICYENMEPNTMGIMIILIFTLIVVAIRVLVLLKVIVLELDSEVENRVMSILWVIISILFLLFIYCWFTLVQYYFYRATNNCKKKWMEMYASTLIWIIEKYICLGGIFTALVYLIFKCISSRKNIKYEEMPTVNELSGGILPPSSQNVEDI